MADAIADMSYLAAEDGLRRARAWHLAWRLGLGAADPPARSRLSVTAVALHSAGGEGDLAADAAVVCAALGELDGPAILVGHLWRDRDLRGRNDRDGRTSGLVCAFLLPVGVSLLDSLNHETTQWIRSTSQPASLAH